MSPAQIESQCLDYVSTLRLCLNVHTAQALTQLLDHSDRVSLINLCFDLKQYLMINYLTIGGIRYMKRR